MNNNRVVNIVRVSNPSSDWKSWLKTADFSKLAGIKNLDISDEVKLILSAEAYQYAITNKAEPVLQNFIEQVGSKGVTGFVLKVGEAIDAALSDKQTATFNPWFKNVKAWRNTEPVTLPLRFEFKMGQFGLWDARQEVALPILALLIPSLPRRMDSLTMEGPFQSASSLLALILKGTALNLTGNGMEVARTISNEVLKQINQATYRVSIGKQLMLDKAYCVDASVDMATTVDQNGLPTAGSIQLRFEGAVPPAISNQVTKGTPMRFFTVDGY